MMCDYTYIFDAIDDRLSRAWRIDHRTKTTLEFQVAPGDMSLRYWSPVNTLPHIGDLVDLALAVHMTDRFPRRASNRSCRIHVRMSLRNPDLFNQPETLKLLCDVLYWYTDDIWTFTFAQRTQARRMAERQASFYPLPEAAPMTEVALWSGGLDAFAGLWQRQMHHPETQYVLFGTGANQSMLHRQRELFRASCKVCVAPLTLIRMPLRLRTPCRTTRNRYPRARGFVFLVLGAVCALLQGQTRLHIYENGVGAFNLPFRAAEVGTDYSRAVHPLSLLKIEQLILHLTGSVFTFVQPFLFQTKAEVCAPLLDTPAEALVPLTISCDSRLRRKNGTIQCGHCSSCLLRRQALAVIELVDRTAYDRVDLADPDDRFVLEAMIAQRDMLRQCFASTNPWVALRNRYPDLEKTVTRIARATGKAPAHLATHIRNLYERYADEWDQVQHLLDCGSAHPIGQAFSLQEKV